MTIELLQEHQSELGKATVYESTYNPEKLFPISRTSKRLEIGIHSSSLPFYGHDYWNHYEVSWLNEKGKPIVALAEIIFGCDSPFLIESKSMKLYFNSLNHTKFTNELALVNTIKKDLQERVHADVIVNLFPLDHFNGIALSASLAGICIDDLDVACSQYTTDPTLLLLEDIVVKETVHSHLLKSNCLVTEQPDWASVQISYQGKKIKHESLLQYIVSYRNHAGFGEHCVEQIFMDLYNYCKPQELTVLGQYTRRGGIDIKSIRSTHKISITHVYNRLSRQ